MLPSPLHFSGQKIGTDSDFFHHRSLHTIKWERKEPALKSGAYDPSRMARDYSHQSHLRFLLIVFFKMFLFQHEAAMNWVVIKMPHHRVCLIQIAPKIVCSWLYQLYGTSRNYLVTSEVKLSPEWNRTVASHNNIATAGSWRQWRSLCFFTIHGEHCQNMGTHIPFYAVKGSMSYCRCFQDTTFSTAGSAKILKTFQVGRQWREWRLIILEQSVSD